MMTDEYSVCGNVAVGHKLLKDGDDLERVTADIAIFALGWESRFLALESHVALDVKQILVLDFELADTGDHAIEANRKKARRPREEMGRRNYRDKAGSLDGISQKHQHAWPHPR
ncbi:hypothetical protein LZK82_17175 [Rhizobium leguminosarum]|nr:hypothetical protein LZK82_17175 [Rhizobium leguminosarum]